MDIDSKISEAPDIYSYFDYREYLKDLLLYKRKLSAVFSHRYIVQKAGFKSPTALKHVIDGKRNISLDAANRFATALKIEGGARHYFLTLILFNQSESLVEQEHYLNELLALKKAEHPGKLGDNHFDVLDKWYHLVIRELVSLPDFKNSPRWIARTLASSVTAQDAADSIALLLKLGIIEKKEGKLLPVERTIATDHQVYSVKAAGFHRQMIERGIESITSCKREDREISGTVLRISRHDADAVKSALRDFRKKMLTLAAQSTDADQVYQLNFQFFPHVNLDRAMAQTGISEE